MKRMFTIMLPAIVLLAAGCSTAPRMPPMSLYPAPATMPVVSSQPLSIPTNSLPLSELALPRAPGDAEKLLSNGAWVWDGLDYLWVPASYIAKPGSMTVWGGEVGVGAGYGYGWDECWPGYRWPDNQLRR